MINISRDNTKPDIFEHKKVFPEISKLKNKNEITSIRSKLRIVILISLFIPIVYILLEDIANSVFINVLGAEFENVFTDTRKELKLLPEVHLLREHSQEEILVPQRGAQLQEKHRPNKELTEHARQLRENATKEAE